MSVFRVNIYLLAVTVMNNAASSGPWRPTRRTNTLSRCARYSYSQKISMKTYSILSGCSAISDSCVDTKFKCLKSLSVMYANNSLMQKNDVVTSY